MAGAIDVHVHALVSLDELLAEIERAGLEKAVLIYAEINPGDALLDEVRSALSARHPGLYGTLPQQMKSFLESVIAAYPEAAKSNEELASWISSRRDKLIGFGSVDPHRPEDEIKHVVRRIEELGLRGIKVMPTFQLFKPGRTKGLETVFSEAEKRKLIVLYHTGCDPGPFENPGLSEDARPRHLDGYLDMFPNLNLILAHTGSYSAYEPGIWLDEALALIKKYPNVYGDTAAVYWFLLSEPAASRIRGSAGFERMLFGSDYPVVAGGSIASAARFVEERSALTSREKELVLHDNASSLLS